jgi:hypothetical protein
MLRFLITLVASACVVSFAQAQDAIVPPQDKLACDGPFAKDSSHAKLISAFGPKNVSFEDVDGAEGAKEKASVLFANEPTRRVEIFWHDEAKRARPASIRIRTPSQWIGPEGLSIGLRIEQVEKVNGRPFKVNGFEWDYGGYVVNLDGKLKTLPGGCSAGIRFEASRALKRPKFDPVIGEKQVLSTSALLRQVRPMVSEWSVGYGK